MLSSKGRALAVRATLTASVLLASLAVSERTAAATALEPLNVTAVAAGPSSLRVSWTAQADPGRDRFWIGLYDEAIGVWGWRSVSKAATSDTIGGLTPGRTYRVMMYSEGPIGNYSNFVNATAKLPNDVCGTTLFCVAVDIARPEGALTNVGSGLLHGATTATPTDTIASLRLKSWRIVPFDTQAFAIARASGAKVTALMSDGWGMFGNWTEESRYRNNPWDDWDYYRLFIQVMVQWHIDNGIVPDVWDIQNEPDWGNYALTSPPTRARIFEQFRVAHDAIRSVLPDAVIEGPAFSGSPIFYKELIDYPAFLDFAVAHGLRFDVLSWHSLSSGTVDSWGARPRTIEDDAATVRGLLADRPSLGTPKLSVSEYGAPFWQGHPGATVAYFNALERAGVSTANLACWGTSATWTPGAEGSTCFNSQGLLDGLRTVTGTTSANYWTYVAYGAMSGTRLQSTVNDPWASSLVSVGADGVIDMLIGRAHNCAALVQVHCPAGLLLDPTLKGQVVVSGVKSAYQVTVQRIPNKAGTVNGPISVSKSRVAQNNGKLKFSLGNVPDGDAIVVKLVPVS